MWPILKETFARFFEDKVPRLGAALAYYTIFSLAPLLLIALWVAAFFFGEETAEREMMGQLTGMIGQSGAEAVRDFVDNARDSTGGGRWASLFAVAMMVFGATGVFGQLQDALNTIWGVQARPKRGLVATFIRDRVLSFAMVLGIGFLLLVSLVISALISGLGNAIQARVAIPGFAFQAVNLMAGFGISALLFMMIYKVLPDVEIGWGDVWHGAFASAALFTIGKYFIGLYLGRGSIASSYGAAASLVVILIWVYYSSQILFLGAEFTEVCAHRSGKRVRASETAVPLTQDARERQGLEGKSPAVKKGRDSG